MTQADIGCQMQTQANAIKEHESEAHAQLPESQPQICLERSAELIARLRRLIAQHTAQDGETSEEEFQSITRRAVWSALGDSHSAGSGISLVASTLQQAGSILEGLEVRFRRFHEEFVCLDDGEVEELFGGQGALGSAAEDSEQAAQACRHALLKANKYGRKFTSSAAEATASLTLPDPETAIVALETSSTAVDSFTAQAGVFGARRQAAVARAKAAMEVRASIEAASAHGILSQALKCERRLDFPAVTDICERATSDCADMEDVVQLLAAHMRDDACDESPAALSRKLKVLTVAHEMLYSESASSALANTPGVLEALQRTLDSPSACAPGPAPECLRLLSTELLNHLQEFAPVDEPAVRCSIWPLRLRPSRQTPRADLHTDTSKSSAQHSRAQREQRVARAEKMSAAEGLVRRLRKKSAKANACAAAQVLDGIFRLFDEFSTSLSRLHEELDCLPGIHGLDKDLKDLAALLFAATDFQKQTMAWKCYTMEGSDLGKNRKWGADLAGFLEEAIAMGDRMEVSLCAYTSRRDQAVDLTRAAIETAGCAVQIAHV